MLGKIHLTRIVMKSARVSVLARWLVHLHSAHSKNRFLSDRFMIYMVLAAMVWKGKKRCSVCSVQIVVNQKKGGKNAKNLKNLSGRI